MTDKDLADIKGKIDQWAEQCDREFAIRLIDMFLTDAPKRLTTLRQAFEQRAQDEFKRAAHTLKSSSGQLGANAYANVTLRVEMAARDGRMGEMAESIKWLEQEFVTVKAALEKLRDDYREIR